MVSKIETIIFLVAALYCFSIFSAHSFALNATRTDALNAINQSQQHMKELIAAGFSVNSINDIITSAEQALERADFAELIRNNATGELAQTARKALEGLNYKGFTYDEVLKYSEKVTSLKLQAYNVSDSLRALEIKTAEYNKTLDVSDVEKILENARTAFNYERYDEAENLISQANDLLDSKRAELATFNILVKSSKTFFEKYWREATVIITIAIVCGYFGWRAYDIRRIKSELKKLKIERESLTSLVKRAQIERFEKKELSTLIYNMRIEKYKKRMSEIDVNIPVLEAMLERKRIKLKNIFHTSKKQKNRRK